jgi:hypothetical protein
VGQVTKHNKAKLGQSEEEEARMREVRKEKGKERERGKKLWGRERRERINFS